MGERTSPSPQKKQHKNTNFYFSTETSLSVYVFRRWTRKIRRVRTNFPFCISLVKPCHGSRREPTTTRTRTTDDGDRWPTRGFLYKTSTAGRERTRVPPQWIARGRTELLRRSLFSSHAHDFRESRWWIICRSRESVRYEFTYGIVMSTMRQRTISYPVALEKLFLIPALLLLSSCQYYRMVLKSVSMYI